MYLLQRLITDNLYKILTTTIANTRLYRSRTLGFRSELEFVRDFIKTDQNFLSGGQFLFGKNRNENVNDRQLIYVTVSTESLERYVDFYKELKKFPLCGRLFFLQCNTTPQNWGKIDFRMKGVDNEQIIEEEILEPTFTCYEFQEDQFVVKEIEEIRDELEDKINNSSCAVRKERDIFNYLEIYSEDELAQIYTNRFFLDVLLRDKKKGMIDIDGIWFNSESYKLIELKEKDAGPRNRATTIQDKWYFGWDSRRIAWYLFILATTGMSTIYALREVNNQTQRNFVAWKYMLLEEFARNASWGVDTGPTMTAPYNLFQNLETLKRF